MKEALEMDYDVLWNQPDFCLAFLKSDLSSTDTGSEVSEKRKTNVLPVYAAKKLTMPGTLIKPTRQPPWYNRRILEEERPDLAGLDGRIRLERELRILNELKKNKCPFCPMVLDSGRVADLPFIVMTLLDRNVEKLREQIGVFRPYGTPDGYTLPYWSIDAHTRSVAREKGDIESWFYVLLEMLSPGCLPWIKTFDEVEIEKAKIAAWRDYSAFENGNPLLSSLHIRMIFELIRSTRDSFDYGLARKIVREALDSNLNGPLILEWAPNTRIALPPLEGQRITTQAKGMQRVMTPQAKVQRMVMNRLPQQVDRACEGATANRQQRRRLTAEGTMATVVSGEKLMKNNHQQKTPQERTPRNGPTQTKQQVIRKPPIYRK
uniref:Protein kinase domain-containing protein n=1 Tax=Angiostrongylus cantonensis TaxID=6313 RepID=A0A158P8D2_ANGCA